MRVRIEPSIWSLPYHQRYGGSRIVVLPNVSSLVWLCSRGIFSGLGKGLTLQTQQLRKALVPTKWVEHPVAERGVSRGAQGYQPSWYAAALAKSRPTRGEALLVFQPDSGQQKPSPPKREEARSPVQQCFRSQCTTQRMSASRASMPWSRPSACCGKEVLARMLSRGTSIFVGKLTNPDQIIWEP